MMELWISSAPLERLAGALLHFVWQGAAIAVAAAVVLRLLDRRPAEWRYAAAAVSLLVMLTAPIMTFAFYTEAGALTARALHTLNGAAAGAAQAAPAADIALWTQRIVLVWALGVVAFLTRLSGGWLLSRAIVRSAGAIVDPLFADALARAREGLACRSTVRLLTSLRVQTPVVIGWLRPAIVLPACALTGLDAEQVLAILAHELAHIRRHDFLVNAVQRAVECVLFYHPAVWWISGRIRVERERCCDDLAVRVCGDKLVYAQALIALEKARMTGPALAVPAAGHGVTDRVRRILGARSPARDWQSAAAALLFVAILVGAGAWQPAVLAQQPVLSVASTAAQQLSPADNIGPVESRDTIVPIVPIEDDLHIDSDGTSLGTAPSPDGTNGAIAAIAAIATAQAGARPNAAVPPVQVPAPAITASREAAREKLGQLRVDYSADAFIKQAGEGDTIAVRTFLEAGMDVDQRDTDGFTALIKAAQMGRTETVQFLIAAGANPNLGSAKTQSSPLMHGAERGDLTMLRALLAGGANVDLQMPGPPRGELRTALTVAAYTGQRDAVILLLDHGATEKNQALVEAACLGRVETTQLLANRGASLVPASARSVMNCLRAIRSPEILKFLFDNGADIALNRNALSTITCDNPFNMDAVRFLVDHGADVNAPPTPQNRSPLFCAARSHSIELMTYLLANGADIKGDAGILATALSSGGEQDRAIAAALFLIDRGAIVNPPPPGNAPLSTAVRLQLIDVVRALLDKGADLNDNLLVEALDPQQRVDGALLAPDPEIALLLIEHGANVNARNNYGLPPLLIAVRARQTEIVRALLARGADPNFRSGSTTPLTEARGSDEITRMLIAAGAKP
ncbi:MAG TPA: ankyrin repeat domain-containing protein [Terriglobia bacterium]|nr:ankyrin repeat domain-containing protein [Terriglobia bacterium]